jgi:hypothetical protein
MGNITGKINTRHISIKQINPYERNRKTNIIMPEIFVNV